MSEYSVMKNFSQQKWRGVVVESLENIDLASIPWESPSELEKRFEKVLKITKTRRVMSMLHEGNLIYIKRYKQNKFFARVRASLGISRAKEEAFITNKCLSKKISTHKILLVAEEKCGLERTASVIITQAVKGQEIHKQWLALSCNKRKELLKNVATFLFDVHSKGFVHDDLKSDHIFVKDDSFSLIDLHNGYFKRNVPVRLRAKNIYQMFRQLFQGGATYSDVARFLKVYATEKKERKRLWCWLKYYNRFSRSNWLYRRGIGEIERKRKSAEGKKL